MHPYELDVHEVKELRRQGWNIGRWIGFQQSLFRSRVAGRLRALLERYRFGPAATALGLDYAGKPGPEANQNR